MPRLRGEFQTRLTPHHHFIIALVTIGMSNKEIGQLLGSTDHNIGNLMTEILRRTGARNRTQLAVLAILARLPKE